MHPASFADIVCPIPSQDSVIVTDDTRTVFNYGDVVRFVFFETVSQSCYFIYFFASSYKCADDRYYIKKVSDPLSSLNETIDISCEWNSENWDAALTDFECIRKHA